MNETRRLNLADRLDYLAELGEGDMPGASARAMHEAAAALREPAPSLPTLTQVAMAIHRWLSGGSDINEATYRAASEVLALFQTAAEATTRKDGRTYKHGPYTLMDCPKCGGEGVRPSLHVCQAEATGDE